MVGVKQYFAGVVDRAQKAQKKAEDAQAKAKEDLEKDVAEAKAKVATDQAKVAAKVEGAQDKASSAWAELGASWDAHVIKVKTAFSEKQHEVDTKLATREADLAESDASYAVNIALSAIQEAEDAVLYAIYARKYADDLV